MEQDGSFVVVDQSFSQMVETLQGVSREDMKKFRTGENSVINHKGQSVKLVIMENIKTNKSPIYIV